MLRFWPTLAIAGILMSGCSGQNLEGRWKGSLPYADAEDCRIKMYSDGRFDLVCAHNAWVGAGRYRRSGNELIFDYVVLTRNGTAIDKPEPLDFTLDGRGNEIRLDDGRQVHVWNRVLAR
jgi:hypothetical protein